MRLAFLCFFLFMSAACSSLKEPEPWPAELPRSSKELGSETAKEREYEKFSVDGIAAGLASDFVIKVNDKKDVTLYQGDNFWKSAEGIYPEASAEKMKLVAASTLNFIAVVALIHFSFFDFNRGAAYASGAAWLSTLYLNRSLNRGFTTDYNEHLRLHIFGAGKDGKKTHVTGLSWSLQL